MLRCQVVRLRSVFIGVVQLPLLGVVVAAGLVVTDRLPAVVPDGAMAEHLEVLLLLARGQVARAVGQGIGHRGAVHRHLLDAIDHLGKFKTQQFKHGGRDVGHMVELTPDAALVLDARRPMHDERIAHATGMGVLLVALERRVADHGPAPGVVGMAVGSADQVQPFHGLVHIFAQAVEVAHLVEHTGRAAFLAGTVVRHGDEDGVVQLAQALQRIDVAAQMVIGVVDEGGKGLLQARSEFAFVVGQCVPGLDAGVAWRQRGVCRHDAQFLLPREPALAHHIPTLVKLAADLGQKVGGRLVRRMACAKGQVGEEGPVRRRRHMVVRETDRLVDQVGREVVALCGRAGRLDVVVVLHQLGTELVGLALEEAIEAVEAARQRPVAKRAGRAGLVQRREMPFADHVSAKALLAQDFGQRRCRARDRAAHIGKTGVEVGDGTHAHGVVVAPGEHAGARG